MREGNISRRTGQKDRGHTPPLCASEPASAVADGGAAADAAGVAGAGAAPPLDAEDVAAAGGAFPFVAPLPCAASPLGGSAPSLPAFSTCEQRTVLVPSVFY